MRIKISDFFEAQHQLPDTEYLITKACNNYHGHTYKCEVNFEGSKLRGGMVVDFRAIKNLIAKLDHTAIYEKGNLMIDFIKLTKPSQEVIVLDEPPTSENIAKYLCNLIWKVYGHYGITDLEVRICEGYKGEERACWTTYSIKDKNND